MIEKRMKTSPLPFFLGICALCYSFPTNAYGDSIQGRLVSTAPLEAVALPETGNLEKSPAKNPVARLNTSLEKAEASIAPAPDTTTAGDGTDGGDFVLSFQDSSDPKMAKIVSALRASESVQQVIDGLNETLKLPRNLPINFSDCEDPNAYYDSEAKAITVCYQMVKLSYRSFKHGGENVSRTEAMASAENAAVFFLLHEVGHALIDLYDLSVLGRDEDAADYLGLILTSRFEKGEEIVVDAALQFAAFAEEEDEAGHDFSDEHSPSAIRAFNMLCLLYGSDTERFASMVGDDALPKDRADQCPGEYKSVMKAGERLLERWIKA